MNARIDDVYRNDVSFDEYVLITQSNDNFDHAETDIEECWN